MKTVNISVALDKSAPTKILLGRQGENKATKIFFDCNVYAESFGAGTAYLFHQRAPDTCPYPAAIKQDGNTIMWEVSASDTEFAGQGQCELFWYVDDIIAKTQVWSTTVTEALTGTESEEVPEAAQGWVSKVLQAIADIGKVNDEVVKAAVAEYIAENGLPDTRGVGFTSWSYDTDTGYIHLYNEDGEEAIEPLYAPGLGFADLTEDELQQVNTILTRASNYAAQAGQAKEAASASAENATKSAQDAATSAERATQSASAAATSETNASQYASSAAADADLAKQYNDSALKAAGEAAQSLSGAQDAAETAQEAAQEAIAARDGFKVDTTLSQSGQAADAKAVGDALSSLSEENAELKSDLEKLKQNGTGTGTGLSTEAIDKLEEVGNYLVYTTADGGSKWTELISILRNGSSGGDSGDTDVTLTSISATYTGGEVATGTALTDLTGITVTGTYSDGSTSEITGYTLSGEIVEGSNTITVSYGGKTTTFTVTGVAESSGGDSEAIDAYTAYEWTDGVYLVWNTSTNVASETTNDTMTSSEYINLDGVTKIEATELSGKNIAQYNVIFYDENKNGISSASGYVRKNNATYPSPDEITIPEGAVYVRFCGKITVLTADGTTNVTLKYYIYKG